MSAGITEAAHPTFHWLRFIQFFFQEEPAPEHIAGILNVRLGKQRSTPKRRVAIGADHQVKFVIGAIRQGYVDAVVFPLVQSYDPVLRAIDMIRYALAEV